MSVSQPFWNIFTTSKVKLKWYNIALSCPSIMMVSFCVIRLELEDFSKDVDIDFNCNRSIEVRIFELSKPYFIFISNFDKGTILSAMKIEIIILP